MFLLFHYLQLVFQSVRNSTRFQMFYSKSAKSIFPPVLNVQTDVSAFLWSAFSQQKPALPPVSPSDRSIPFKLTFFSCQGFRSRFPFQWPSKAKDKGCCRSCCRQLTNRGFALRPEHVRVKSHHETLSGNIRKVCVNLIIDKHNFPCH